MRLLQCGVGFGMWALAAAALAAEPAGKASAPAAEAPRITHVVVIQDKVPLLFGENQIGELAEGVRLEVREAKEGWTRVRATFGTTWVEGWIRAAMASPDSMAEVPIKIAPTRPLDLYRDPTDARKDHIVAGHQLIEVKVKFEPTAKSPARLYFNWADERSADLYLRFGREGRAVPYGFIRQVEGMTRAAFERDEKRQVLLLKPDQPLVETYVFAVPVRAGEFALILKDVTTRVPIRPR